jgi:uncharacterized cupredoxin-like copper-binding protein
MNLRVLVLSLLVAALGMTIAPPVALPQTHAAKTTTVSVTAKEFSFKLSKSSVPHGKVTFKVVNRGKLKHDFWISGHKTKLLAPGKSATLTVTLSKGKKAYKCTVAGHAAAGMKGTLKVT